MKTFGSADRVSFSPIVTIEPRRRKFHCPIKLKIPLPDFADVDDGSNLRLLCSITDGAKKTLWEDVTGSTPLSIVDNCLMFTTTVSARFWLVHARHKRDAYDATKFAAVLHRQLICVPYMAKFVVFAKRRDISEASLRVFCVLDDEAADKKTLEAQEHYTQVAKSRDVEVYDSQALYLEFGGNLEPVQFASDGSVVQAGGHHISSLSSSRSLINEQLELTFRAFEENRLAFVVRLRDVSRDAAGKLAFMADSLRFLASLNDVQRRYLTSRRRRAVCTLGVALPQICVPHDAILGTPRRNARYASAKIGALSLADISAELDGDRDELEALAARIGIPNDELRFIELYCASTANKKMSSDSHLSPALLLLMHWYRLSSDETRDQDLARALVAIGRRDVSAKLGFAVEPKKMSTSVMELLREIDEIPVARERSTDNLQHTAADESPYNYNYYYGHRYLTPAAASDSNSEIRFKTSSSSLLTQRRRSKSGGASTGRAPSNSSSQARATSKVPTIKLDDDGRNISQGASIVAQRLEEQVMREAIVSGAELILIKQQLLQQIEDCDQAQNQEEDETMRACSYGVQNDDSDDETLAQVTPHFFATSSSTPCDGSGLMQDLTDISRAAERLDDIIDACSTLSAAPSRAASSQRSVSPASFASWTAEQNEKPYGNGSDSDSEPNSQVD